MKIVKTINMLRKNVQTAKDRGRQVGFVPTMGFLHQGHLSLVERAKEENDIVVVSIFVNPKQFSPREDFQKYPRNLKRDARLLRGRCDILFAPSVGEVYPEGCSTLVEVKELGDGWCGKTRKGHFVGVTTVVLKLFSMVMPDVAYFGQKDAQQAIIIKKMVADLNLAVRIKVMPIVREKDGLAMSSRNAYLSEKERKEAVVLFQALKSAERLAARGTRDSRKIVNILRDFISRTACAKIDYIGIVDKMTLEPLRIIEKEALLLLAVYIGKTRLIDNTLLQLKSKA